jgi:hypothetical protein
MGGLETFSIKDMICPTKVEFARRKEKAGVELPGSG